MTQQSADAAKTSAEAGTKAVALSERNTRVTARAVVLLDKVIALPTAGPNEDYFTKKSLIMATLKNSGSTLAKGVKLTGEMRYPCGSFEFRELPEATIAPQSVNEWITLSLGGLGSVSDDTIADLNRKNNFFTFEIRVTYKDVFENPYEYKVCGLYIPLLRRFIITSTA